MPEVLDQIKSLAQACGGTVSVCVRNISNAFDFDFNSDVRVGSASTIKVAIALEALRQARDGELFLDESYTVRAEHCCAGSGVLTHLHDGLEVTLRDLLTLMVIVSDNTATNIVIDAVGLEKVNSTLREFGCTGTALLRKMYDWDGIAQGRDNFVVAREMAELLARIARKTALGPVWDELLLGILGKQLFTDELGLLLPEGVLANKTGQVNDVVHDCGVVTTDEFGYSIAVFTKAAPSAGEAKVAIGRISKVVFDTCKTC